MRETVGAPLGTIACNDRNKQLPRKEGHAKSCGLLFLEYTTLLNTILENATQ